jgi:hypothetical protein
VGVSLIVAAFGHCVRSASAAVLANVLSGNT